MQDFLPRQKENIIPGLSLLKYLKELLIFIVHRSDKFKLRIVFTAQIGNHIPKINCKTLFFFVSNEDKSFKKMQMGSESCHEDIWSENLNSLFYMCVTLNLSWPPKCKPFL